MELRKTGISVGYKYSEVDTRHFFESILHYGFKLEFFVDNKNKVDKKYIPKELLEIVNDGDEFYDNDPVVYNSVLSLAEKVIILVNLKIYFNGKTIQLLPIEAKYYGEKVNAISLIDELIRENNLEITETRALIRVVSQNIYSDNSLNYSTIINSLMSFLNLIWGIDDEIWDYNKFSDVGLSNWYCLISKIDPVVTIQGKLFEIPETLIKDFFETENFNLNQNRMGESSKRCLKMINEYIYENNSFFDLGFAPKFTWSTPTDATWILSNRSICCKSIEDIFTLLKASTKISCDIEKAKEKEITNTLLLREYLPTLNLMFEFRVFLGGHSSFPEYKILGISQRHIFNYYRELSENIEIRSKIISCISKFFLDTHKNSIMQIFDLLNTKCVAFDIYISVTKSKFSPLIIDVQPIIW
ncbi:D123 family protein [Cryptosporidium felis]|nr:D123 family protein [Cryptosporidium felis]